MKRREFNRYLQHSALSLALLPWMQALAAPADRARPWRVNPFALGVASGRPRPDSLVLWTRLLVDEQDRAVAGNDAIDVTIEVFADNALKQRKPRTQCEFIGAVTAAQHRLLVSVSSRRSTQHGGTYTHSPCIAGRCSHVAHGINVLPTL